MSDELVFAPVEETDSYHDAHAEHPWRVLIVDDDESVHTVTQLALSDFKFSEAPLEFLHAYSGTQARALLQENDDIAVVLLDVVMETEHAGLGVVQFIRNELQNKNIRIVLRTGQPGQAPEKEVITEYDINDYKEKTELTAHKLYTLMYSCLRSYRDIIALDESRQGLERVIDASKHVFANQFLEEFASGVLQQITSILHLDKDAFVGQMSGLAAQEFDDGIRIVAGIGKFSSAVGDNVLYHIPEKLSSTVLTDSTDSVFEEDFYLGSSLGQAGTRNVIYLSGLQENSDIDHHLIDLFSQNVLIALDNLSLREQVLDTQREIVYRLGEAVESRSKETGNHVKRVAEISKILALGCGVSAADAEILKHASPLHDLGKIAIPDSILNKPGALDTDEWEKMKAHAQIGHDMLSSSKKGILQIGALISLEHHEKWDGSGYPLGLKGTDISLEARITAVADVFDALASERSYKKAWPLDDVYDHIKDESGKHFDPKIVEVLFENIDAVNEIRNRYVDEYAE